MQITYLAWNFEPGRQLALEIESYESVTPGEALTLAYGWRSSAVILSLRACLKSSHCEAFVAEAISS
jgi:hypothetical protein